MSLVVAIIGLAVKAERSCDGETEHRIGHGGGFGRLSDASDNFVDKIAEDIVGHMVSFAPPVVFPVTNQEGREKRSPHHHRRKHKNTAMFH